MWRRPKIHSGFDQAWRNNGLNKRVLDKMEELSDTDEVDRTNYQIYVTGKGFVYTLTSFSRNFPTSENWQRWEYNLASLFAWPA